MNKNIHSFNSTSCLFLLPLLNIYMEKPIETGTDGIVVGVDACPNGWLATVIESNNVSIESPYPDFKQLYNSYPNADLILVDIPIGLQNEERRRCDKLARNLLGCRGESVFYAPSEGAIGHGDYGDAKQKHKNDIGHGLMKQAHNLREDILDVRNTIEDSYDGVVRESHPELCFAALNEQPIAYPKSSDVGRELRMQLLESEISNARSLYREIRNQHPLTEVRRDDILDSICLAVAAREDRLVTTPPDPEPTEPRIYYPDFEFASQMRNG